MRLLQISIVYMGAQKKIINAIHKYVMDNGHNSRVLFADGQSDDSNIISYEHHFDKIIRRGLRKVLGKFPRFAFISTFKLMLQIKRYAPDLVHLHVLHHGYLDYELLLKYLAKLRIPVVFTVHDMWLFTGGCYYYSTVDCEGFFDGCKDCPKSTLELDCEKGSTAKYLRKKMKLIQKLKKVSFVSVSPWVYSEIEKSRIASYPQHMIMNSVDDIKYNPFKHKKRDKFTIIGVAANWDERKGLKRFYELGWKLGEICDIILVGDVNNELKKDAPSNIFFYGYTSSAYELYDLYASCDLHVSMSLEETFGLTFVEAALSGIRSMGYNTTAIPYVLEKTYGYIISSCSIDETVSKIRQLVKNRSSCAITEQEYLEIKKYFSSERMAFEYQKVYEKMLELC